jgi:hypothetical protein
MKEMRYLAGELSEPDVFAEGLVMVLKILD